MRGRGMMYGLWKDSWDVGRELDRACARFLFTRRLFCFFCVGGVAAHCRAAGDGSTRTSSYTSTLIDYSNSLSHRIGSHSDLLHIDGSPHRAVEAGGEARRR